MVPNEYPDQQRDTIIAPSPAPLPVFSVLVPERHYVVITAYNKLALYQSPCEIEHKPCSDQLYSILTWECRIKSLLSKPKSAADTVSVLFRGFSIQQRCPSAFCRKDHQSPCHSHTEVGRLTCLRRRPKAFLSSSYCGPKSVRHLSR